MSDEAENSISDLWEWVALAIDDRESEGLPTPNIDDFMIIFRDELLIASADHNPDHTEGAPVRATMGVIERARDNPGLTAILVEVGAVTLMTDFWRVSLRGAGSDKG